jgi:hypothetical protein
MHESTALFSNPEVFRHLTDRFSKHLNAVKHSKTTEEFIKEEK